MSSDINEKIKQLRKEWVEYTHKVKNDIETELINEWTKKHGINSGDDILVKDFHNYRKVNTSFCYYRKAKLIGFNIDVSLNSDCESCNSIYITPVIKVYNDNNKTLQKKPIRYIEFFKMDLNLLDKEVKK
jgi:hypothetical protein